ncbi:Basic helix-loop-helix DNA-binding superfamily protein isoform 1 [Hibiscus syriacus]|uniref:Basic helix-loop-helix DNA-binding superfamily protein isoform 1 n=1 Tax=Hibiscus syriacus TaxID=106335 RepID=A0A6A3BDX6_HIBSY|nr:Basic helix-loop-helix DNA-binding superfamily protein isoform 1 [Hibiscus syriacus]
MVLRRRKPHRRKSSTQALILPIEDVLPDISEESIDFSSISDFSDANFNIETAEISTASRDGQIDFSKTGSAEAEILVSLLKQARFQALDSVDMENKSKKVLDAKR